MKYLFQIIFLVLLLLPHSIAFAEAIPDPTQCSSSEQIEEFNAYWKIISIVNFGVATPFCKVMSPDTFEVCAARMAFDVRLEGFLANYTQGSQACGEYMLQTCTNWCLQYLPAEECTQRCVLPNFKVIE